MFYNPLQFKLHHGGHKLPVLKYDLSKNLLIPRVSTYTIRKTEAEAIAERVNSKKISVITTDLQHHIKIPYHHFLKPDELLREEISNISENVFTDDKKIFFSIEPLEEITPTNRVKKKISSNFIDFFKALTTISCRIIIDGDNITTLIKLLPDKLDKESIEIMNRALPIPYKLLNDSLLKKILRRKKIKNLLTEFSQFDSEENLGSQQYRFLKSLLLTSSLDSSFQYLSFLVLKLNKEPFEDPTELTLLQSAFSKIIIAWDHHISYKEKVSRETLKNWFNLFDRLYLENLDESHGDFVNLIQWFLEKQLDSGAIPPFLLSKKLAHRYQPIDSQEPLFPIFLSVLRQAQEKNDLTTFDRLLHLYTDRLLSSKTKNLLLHILEVNDPLDPNIIKTFLIKSYLQKFKSFALFNDSESSQEESLSLFEVLINSLRKPSDRLDIQSLDKTQLKDLFQAILPFIEFITYKKNIRERYIKLVGFPREIFYNMLVAYIINFEGYPIAYFKQLFFSGESVDSPYTAILRFFKYPQISTREKWDIWFGYKKSLLSYSCQWDYLLEQLAIKLSEFKDQLITETTLQEVLDIKKLLLEAIFYEQECDTLSYGGHEQTATVISLFQQILTRLISFYDEKSIEQTLCTTYHQQITKLKEFLLQEYKARRKSDSYYSFQIDKKRFKKTVFNHHQKKLKKHVDQVLALFFGEEIALNIFLVTREKPKELKVAQFSPTLKCHLEKFISISPDSSEKLLQKIYLNPLNTEPISRIIDILKQRLQKQDDFSNLQQETLAFLIKYLLLVTGGGINFESREETENSIRRNQLNMEIRILKLKFLLKTSPKIDNIFTEIDSLLKQLDIFSIMHAIDLVFPQVILLELCETLRAHEVITPRSTDTFFQTDSTFDNKILTLLLTEYLHLSALNEDGLEKLGQLDELISAFITNTDLIDNSEWEELKWIIEKPLKATLREIKAKPFEFFTESFEMPDKEASVNILVSAILPFLTGIFDASRGSSEEYVLSHIRFHFSHLILYWDDNQLGEFSKNLSANPQFKSIMYYLHTKHSETRNSGANLLYTVLKYFSDRLQEQSLIRKTPNPFDIFYFPQLFDGFPEQEKLNDTWIATLDTLIERMPNYCKIKQVRKENPQQTILWNVLEKLHMTGSYKAYCDYLGKDYRRKDPEEITPLKIKP